MKKLNLVTFVLLFTFMISKAQTTAMQFSGNNCNGIPVDLFADLDAGKVVILHFFMPSCGSCPPPAQKIKTMANRINATHPGMVKGYAFPYQNSTTCTYASSWVSSNNLGSLYQPMNNGAAHVAHYGGFGMPTVVLLAGADHRVMFSTLSFSTSDTTIMKDSILNFLNSATRVADLAAEITTFSVFPNPANDFVTITIDLNESSNTLIEVADITGNRIAIVAEERINGLVAKKFNTSTLPNGNYFIRLLVNGKTSTQKFTVNH